MRKYMGKNYRSDFGDVIVTTTYSQRAIITCSVFIFICVLLFISIADYTQKRTVNGIVYPDKGIVNIKSKQSGTLSAFYIKGGDYINTGEKLFSIDASSSTQYFRNNEENYRELLSKLREVSGRETQDNINTLNARKKLTEEQIDQTRNSIAIMTNQVRLLDAAIQSQQVTFDRIQDAYKKKYVSDIEKNNAEMQLIDKKMQRQSINNEISSREGQIISLKKELDDTIDRIKNIQNEDKKESLQSLMKLYGIASDTESVLRAPVAGKVAEIVERTGRFVNAGDTILTVIPQGSVNQIVAFISPELIGEIKKGTKVALKYDSYPYQRFGVEHGVIIDISRVPLQPEDIYTNFGLKFENACFRVGIKIIERKESITIIPGMSLKVEIPTRKASIIKWIFPFFGDKSVDI
ncbi:TPA: HlyD family efflux transporter periplasmic adaptor subunit [Escherichia coli]|nr:HlyD family efflux transporter periplasmic adaptor subunit [Escherichia coli]HBA7793583.1 HlyD family efflux transporter periplasmic adaptor subunit [Escherichia coli]HBA8668233.1 HlyD family efflux transporter periplasmic adaptor subunit [Escherichia coli]HBA8708638.1 HlyD family efflux transporter periplasmic adaptor subunit [Escherichia coli]HBA9370757.1 HlyD family efflux transporter periplasmic adaptor subunit [Escherichia coli]